MPTISAMIEQSFVEIRVARAGESLEPENMALGLYLFNRRLDSWNANQRAVYAERHDDFTLTASLSPHTIGPSSATWTLSVRPTKLLAVSINIGNNIHTPVNVRDAAWYAQQAAPAITESVPTDVYYRAGWPNGSLYFYGVPSTAYTARIWSETILASVAQTDTFAMPPGYQEALELTLAEDLAESLGQSVSSKLAERARKARALVFDNNDHTPSIVTADAGLTTGTAQDIDYRSRRLR